MTAPAESPRPWRLTTSGAAVRVRVTPKSSREGVDGVTATPEGPAFTLRVRAAPEDGAANAAAARCLAERLCVPKSSVRLVQGAKARVKMLEVSGGQKTLEERLARILAEVS